MLMIEKSIWNPLLQKGLSLKELTRRLVLQWQTSAEKVKSLDLAGRAIVMRTLISNIVLVILKRIASELLETNEEM